MSGDGLRDELIEVLGTAAYEWARDRRVRRRVPMVERQTDAVLAKVQAHIDAAREQVAEQIAQAIETAPYPQPETAAYVRKQAVAIARQHALDGTP